VDDEGGYSADGRLLTNIVMMGMGEPLYNFDMCAMR
jgi:23S rRNA (adenine2503-C2)-methyltransferase